LFANACTQARNGARTEKHMKRVMLSTVALLSVLGLPFGAHAQTGDWYIAGGASLSLREDASGEISNAPVPGSTVRIENEFNTGYGAQAAIGRQFDRFRIEAELGYTRDRQDTYTAIVPPTGEIPADVEETTTRAMLNAYVDFPAGRLTPYVGAGVGYAWTALEFVAPRAPMPAEPPRTLIDDSDESFAYQLIGGAALAVSDRVALTLQYRWFDAGDFEARDTRGEPVRRDHAGHNIDFGVRVQF